MTVEIDIPDAPAIEGLTFRRFRGAEDYAVMVGIMTSCNEADRLNYNESVEDVAHVFTHLTHCNPYRDMLFAEADGKPVAYSRVFWKDEEAGLRLYVSIGFVIPAFRRRGLGAAILHWNEARACRIAADHPQDVERAHHVWATDGEPGAIALFDSSGYRIARTMVEMTRPIALPLQPVALPERLVVRRVVPSEYRAVWDAWEEAYRDHWGFAPRTDEDYARWTTSRLFQPELWQVAWDGGEVAGMVLNYVDQRRNEAIGTRRGYTQNVFVRRRWRRRGLARALLVRSIEAFREMGMEETYLGVDTESPTGADWLYGSLGYSTARKHLVYRKSLRSEGDAS